MAIARRRCLEIDEVGNGIGLCYHGVHAFGHPLKDNALPCAKSMPKMQYNADSGNGDPPITPC